MIRRRKIKNIKDAVFAIDSIIKIYKKITPNFYAVPNLIDTYRDACKIIQNKFRGSDLSIYKLSEDYNYHEFDSPNEFKNFNEELISKAEGLKDFLESKKGKFDSEYKKIEERLEILEKEIKKFDERLNSAAGELGVFNGWRKDLKEMVDFHRKNKDKRISK